MARHASDLPQLRGQVMLTDTGIETDVVFRVGRDLPSFALFPLLEDEGGRQILDNYYREHVAVAAEHGLGYVLETPTWRSNPDWGASLGYTQARLDDLDRMSVAFLSGIRDTTEGGPRPISGLLGPRGDGYAVDHLMTAEEALDYHQHQVQVFAGAGCDLVTACTLTYPAEGMGIALAARELGVPVVLYVTLETDGRLPDGTSLHEAIDVVDSATDGYVAYFGVNCAHPDHMAPAFADGGSWTARILAVRANASRLSHAELDVAEELDAGDPLELGAEYGRLREVLPDLAVFGGCCGTDARHLRAIAAVVSG